MTAGQARALDQLTDRYCLPVGLEPSGAENAFGRPGPIGLEIGFGMGQALLRWAVERPEWNLFGVEVYQPGIGSLLLGLERQQLSNVRIFEAAAEDVLAKSLGGAKIDEVRIFFPDPWPKKRHHKRRLIQADFVALLVDRLRPEGRLWLATDWEPYARWMLNVLEAQPDLVSESAAGRDMSDGPYQRLETRFEARGKRLGHRVWDLLYYKKRCSTASR